MTNESITKAGFKYNKELEKTVLGLKQKIDQLRTKAISIYPSIRSATDGKAAGTINMNDAEVLYFLVRSHKPKVIFEIGTWIGTSAMVMAEAMRENDNNGKIYTCDANSYYALDDSYSDIVFPINAYSDKALDNLPTDTKIDMVFADGELTFATIKKLKKYLNSNAIITTHDYTLPA